MRVAALIFVLAACIVPSIGMCAGDQAPVVVNTCNLIYDKSNPSSTIRGLDVQFTNESQKSASVVNIAADINGTTQIIRDQGSFSPGIEIHHEYRTGGQQFALPTVLASIFGSKPEVNCSVSSVHFTDGSRWPTQQAAAQANSAAISVSPLSLNLSGAGTASARLVLASGGGPLSMSSNCGSFATVEMLGSTSRDIALRVTPKAPGNCSISVRDENDNVVTVPVVVQ